MGLAQTGSGKTGAFALPILQVRDSLAYTFFEDRRLAWLTTQPPLMKALLNKPQPFFALVLSPTRELAVQIASQVCLLNYWRRGPS